MNETSYGVRQTIKMKHQSTPRNAAWRSRCLKPLLSVCLSASFASLSWAAEIPAATPKDQQVDKAAQTLEQKWGIQILRVTLSAGGNMVDFRYKVLDPAKAAVLAKRELKPLLIDQTTGAKLVVPDTPKIGQLRQTGNNFVANKTYFMLFANTRKHVKSNDKVTIEVGDFKVENLIVE